MSEHRTQAEQASDASGGTRAARRETARLGGGGGGGAHLPLDLVADAVVLDCDGQVPALVEAAELGVGRVGAHGDGAALWDLDGLGGGEGLGEGVAGAPGRVGVRWWMSGPGRRGSVLGQHVSVLRACHRYRGAHMMIAIA
jgi:hypothetical protein